MGILLICIGILILGIVVWIIADNMCYFNGWFVAAGALIIIGAVGTIGSIVLLIPNSHSGDYFAKLKERQTVVEFAKDYHNIDEDIAKEAVDKFNNRLGYLKEEPFLIKGLVDKHVKEVPYIKLEEWETK